VSIQRLFSLNAHAEYGFVFIVLMLGVVVNVRADDWPKLIFPQDGDVAVVADQIDINRQPTRIWHIHSRKSPDRLLEYYRQKWAIPPQKNAPGFIENLVAEWRIISRFQDGFLIVIQIDGRNKLESNGIISMAQLEGALIGEAKVNKLPEYPRLPGSVLIEELNHHDPGRNALTMILENGSSPASNREFYKKFYESRGWVELSSLQAQTGGANILLLQKGPLEISFTFIKKEAKTQVVGNIQYEES
jgi:hypothetical protein